MIEKITNKDIASLMLKREIRNRKELSSCMFDRLTTDELVNLLDKIEDWKTDDEYILNLLYKHGASRVERNKKQYKLRIEQLKDRIAHFENLLKASDHWLDEMNDMKARIAKNNGNWPWVMEADDIPFFG